MYSLTRATKKASLQGHDGGKVVVATCSRIIFQIAGTLNVGHLAEHFFVASEDDAETASVTFKIDDVSAIKESGSVLYITLG